MRYEKPEDSRGVARNACVSRWVRPSGYILAIALLSAVIAGPGRSYAQSAPDEGLLAPERSYANDIERAAARANQQVFNTLDPDCNPNGELDNIANPDESQSPCAGDVFFIYMNSRELVHTANELTGRGPTISSLGLDQQDLGTALRWTAAEEFAVQSSMATEFASSQLTNLAARMSALRFGARGFAASMSFDGVDVYGPLLAETGNRRGGGASADEGREWYSPWGGFLNGSFGYGNREPTGREDAFDFDGSDITAGIDYRFSNGIIIGGMGGYSRQKVDFDESASEISVVDGEIESDGWSFILFSLFQGERLTVSASLGQQSLDYDAVRNIKYPSFNPDIDSANSITRSQPESDLVSGSLSIGYALNLGRLSIEPYLRADYLDISVDEFTEERSVNALGGERDDDAFNLTIAEQTFQSFDSALGITLQFPLTPRFGVVVPYVTAEAHRESQTDSRVVIASYSALPSAGTFRLPTDERDDDYYTLAVGLSMVIRGGRQRVAEGPIAGGLMAFIQYKTIEDLDFYEDQVITGGLRYEF